MPRPAVEYPRIKVIIVFRYIFLVFVMASVGCIPFSQPLSDPAKAEPDKELIGTWNLEKAAEGFEPGDYTVEMANGKMAPKGLMVFKKGNSTYVFYVSEVGEFTYTTLLFVDTLSKPFLVDEAYKTWSKQVKKEYDISRYVIKNDELIIRFSSYTADIDYRKTLRMYNITILNGFGTAGPWITPAGALADYLKKEGPDVLFPKESVVLKRIKK